MSQDRRPQQQARHWCWTLNNYTNEEHEALMLAGAQLQQLGIKYLVFGRERGEQGTPHLQGYIILTTPVRWSTLNNRLHMQNGRIHWERAMGTAEQASNYCKKDGDFTEFGTLPNPEPTNQFTIIAQKIERAKELLDYGELSLGEIADRLDYSSPAHLSAQFKTLTGLTPRQYKQQKSLPRIPLDKV